MYHTSIENIFQSRDVLSSLDRASDGEAQTVCLIPFGCIDDIFSRLKKKVFPSKKLELIKSKKNIALYNLEVYSRTTGELTHDGRFVVYKMPGYQYAYILISLGNTNFFHHQLRTFIRLFHSEVILPFIKSNDLIRLIENYQSSNKINEIKITRASQKIRLHDEQRMSTLTWNNSSIDDAKEWLDENDGFFKSIQFKAIEVDREVTNSFIDRRGTMRIDKNFSKLFTSCIVPILSMLDSYMKLFENRGRRDNKLLKVRPLEINFETQVFMEKENHVKFIKMMTYLEDTSISVLHANPYMHLSIMDYDDGSSYDLWVVNASQILLVPQLRSSIISLKRIVNHIFDYYAEGEIRDHEN
jgi:hypothetical protein